MVFDRADQKNDALFQEARINVIGAFAAVGLFDHHRDKAVHAGIVVAEVH